MIHPHTSLFEIVDTEHCIPYPHGDWILCLSKIGEYGNVITLCSIFDTYHDIIKSEIGPNYIPKHIDMAIGLLRIINIVDFPDGYHLSTMYKLSIPINLGIRKDGHVGHGDGRKKIMEYGCEGLHIINLMSISQYEKEQFAGIFLDWWLHEKMYYGEDMDEITQFTDYLYIVGAGFQVYDSKLL